MTAWRLVPLCLLCGFVGGVLANVPEVRLVLNDGWGWFTTDLTAKPWEIGAVITGGAATLGAVALAIFGLHDVNRMTKQTRETMRRTEKMMADTQAKQRMEGR